MYNCGRFRYYNLSAFLFRESRHSNRSSPASAPISYQISSLIRSSDTPRSHADRLHGDSIREMGPVVPPELRAKDRSRSPSKDGMERSASSSSIDSCKPALHSPSPGATHKIKGDATKIKEEHKEAEPEPDVLVLGSEPSSQTSTPNPSTPLPPPPQHQAPPTIPHSLPFVHHMGMLDRARLPPFVGVGHFGSNRERFSHPAFPWDPLREAYRNLDLHRRVELQIRPEPGGRFPGMYETGYRDREPHEYSHQDHLLEVRREQERLHLRDELDRARLHQLHQTSPAEGHLAHMPPFLPHLGAMPYRPPPTAALSAPPPLVPSIRPGSPRRTTQPDGREYSPSRNPKEVEAR